MTELRFLGTLVAVAVPALAAACSTSPDSVGIGNGGSAAESGGATTTSSGGGALGGSTTGGGTGQGGATSGGAINSGGSTASGGVSTAGGAATSGGAIASGGSTSSGGSNAAGGNGGMAKGGAASGGSVGAGGASGGGSSTGGNVGSGGGSTGTRNDGPCDVFKAANTPCAAAYSTVRALAKTYSGALYQVRSGSSNQNTGSGGMTKDIGMTADGYADSAAQDAFCSGTTCTISLLYDQSGNGNHLPVAKKGLSAGGSYAAMDDFESSATKGSITVNGHKVYSLYMAAREGYRLAAKGKNIPTGTAAQGIYELADGTHTGSACCWDFGNVSTDPTKYHVMNTLFFGTAYWGKGAGSGPWFMADFEAGVWAGGSKGGDPGWGALNEASPANNNNPSLKVPFALGFLKTSPTIYALRMADLQKATALTVAYEGNLPKAMDNQGGIVLGVGGDNSNNSWGTFYEGAITVGAPSAETELAVMKNVQAAGYPK